MGGYTPAPEVISGARFRAEKGAIEAQVRARRAPVLFVHIHKAGGTTMCNLAKASNLTVPITYSPEGYSGLAGKNCNPSPNHLTAAWTGTADEQYRYASSLRLDFYAHEKFLNAELAWGRMAFVAIIRHPFDRLLSNGRHDGMKCRPAPPAPAPGDGSGAAGWLAHLGADALGGATAVDGSGFSVAPGTRRQAKSFYDYIGCAEANTQVRRLCGCLGRPKAEDCGSFTRDSIPQKQARDAPSPRVSREQRARRPVFARRRPLRAPSLTVRVRARPRLSLPRAVHVLRREREAPRVRDRAALALLGRARDRAHRRRALPARGQVRLGH